VVKLLHSLFALYTGQKKVIEKLNVTVNESKNELKEYEDKIKFLEENERMKLNKRQESEILRIRYKNDIEVLQQKVKSLESKLLITEDGNHKLVLSELELKEQIQKHNKKIFELEHLLDLTKSKMQYEISSLLKQKEQILQDNRSFEDKYNVLKRENDKLIEEMQKLRKEINRLTFYNEELVDQLERWKVKGGGKGSILKLGQIIETPRMQRLTEIERKLETILKYQSAKTNRAQKSSEDEIKESNDEGNLEEMLKDLTAQILDKDELQNPNIIKKFKLDRIRVEDKENEYKNLLRAMGALYFTNRYKAMLPFLFAHWKDLLNERPEKRNVHMKSSTESAPGPLSKALEQEFGNDTQNEGFIGDDSEAEGSEERGSDSDKFATIVRKDNQQEVLVQDSNYEDDYIEDSR